MAERQFGPYRLVRQIAVGGMAEIHLAKTKGIAGFEKYVALKMIHPNFVAYEQLTQLLVDRDVSPQNVLVSYAGEVKLVDFGIAKATSKARQTAAGVIKGKYYYMSPEQAWGEQINARSDIFSAGIVLYEMITGQMLYLEE